MRPKGYKCSIETRLKTSKSMTGIKRGKQSKEHVEKRVNARKGYSPSIEARIKIGTAVKLRHVNDKLLKFFSYNE